MRARLLQKPAPVQDLAPEVPTPAAELVERLLSRSLDERPRSAFEVLAWPLASLWR